MARTDGEQFVRRKIETVHPADTREVSLRLMDFARIKRRLENVPVEPDHFEMWIGCAYGLAASGLLSALNVLGSMHYAPTETKVQDQVTLAVSVLFVVVGIVGGRGFQSLSRTVQSKAKQTCQELVEDLDDMYRSFFPATQEVAEVKPEEKI